MQRKSGSGDELKRAGILQAVLYVKEEKECTSENGKSVVHHYFAPRAPIVFTLTGLYRTVSGSQLKSRNIIFVLIMRDNHFERYFRSGDKLIMLASAVLMHLPDVFVRGHIEVPTVTCDYVRDGLRPDALALLNGPQVLLLLAR